MSHEVFAAVMFSDAITCQVKGYCLLLVRMVADGSGGLDLWVPIGIKHNCVSYGTSNKLQ